VPASYPEELRTAAAYLKEYGKHDYAHAVESLLEPDGWKRLRDSLDQGEKSPLSITMGSELQAAIKDAAEEFGAPLRALAEQGYRKVLAGEWLPERPTRRKPSASSRKSVLQIQVDAALRREVQGQLPRLAAEAGYRVTESGIVVGWICEELGVDRGTGTAMALLLPLPLRDHFVQARDSGVSLDQIVNERVRQMVAGTWKMPRPAKAPKGTWEDGKSGKLHVRIDDSLRDALHEMAPQLSEELGMRVYPGMIVRTILTDRLGSPAE
jgi:hypothetical protein